MTNIININQLDKRTHNYRPELFKKVAFAATRSKGKAIAAIHPGYSRNSLFSESNFGSLRRKAMRKYLGFETTSVEYEKYLDDTLVFLDGADCPVFIFEDPVYGLSSAEETKLFGNGIKIRVPCLKQASPKPKMDFALDRSFSTHWASLRHIFKTLGIRETEYVGELFFSQATNSKLPPARITRGILDLAIQTKELSTFFCVDAAIDGLIPFSFGKISATINYAYTFPGVIDIFTQDKIKS